ncbi:hypothetical protein RJT34_19032 [Clitoria ternatea]|uniref:PGG domain-containing protein n=1 Tax=Clitoria ternatea TaxID=43366 RepID=A0AAN9IQA0_CLITE
MPYSTSSSERCYFRLATMLGTEVKAGAKSFIELVIEGDWEEAIELYEKDPQFQKKKITKTRGTALHVAVNDRREEHVARLVSAIIKHEEMQEIVGKSALRSKNDEGNTPLHLAALRGSKTMCKLIIGENRERKDLIKVRNKQGETPLFLAAVTYQTKVFAYLHDVSKDDSDVALRNEYGNSILHRTIRGELFDLAIVIINLYPQLIESRNNDGVTPLNFLASRPSAFKSGTNFSWWKQILYYFIPVRPLDAKKELDSYLEKMDTCAVPDQQKGAPRLKGKDLLPVLQVSVVSENEDKSLAYTLIPPNYATFFRLVHTTFQLLFRNLGLSSFGYTGIDLEALKMIKQKHVWGGQLLNLFMDKPYESYLGFVTGSEPLVGEEHDEDELMVGSSLTLQQFGEIKQTRMQNTEEEVGKKDTGKSSAKIQSSESAYLTAARNGIVEIVYELQSKISSALHDVTSGKENVLLVAVKNRQPLVVEGLRNKLRKQDFDTLMSGVDYNENTVLHLAAFTISDQEKSWQISGSAMQMMWDIKWYQYIGELVPAYFHFRNNNDGKTAEQIFNEEHKELVTESSEWLKDTSESCSVVAALIAGVSFATSSTVPGGNNGDTGRPALEGQPAFDTFAISSLVGLFFSVTALIMFLSILTSRKQAQDFRRSLPLKLLLGLSSLFVSIASMLISFCAGHFFVLKDKYKDLLFPIYVATCLPVTFYAIVQFPLYVDLVKAIFKKVPQPKDKGGHF